MQIANPLNYPLAVLAGAIVLVAGVRWAKLPSLVVVPAAIMTTIVTASVRKTQEPEPLQRDHPELAQELQAIRQQAKALADKTITFRQEATQVLTKAAQMDLLVAVQYACDRVLELPSKIDHLAKRLQGSDSLLSASDLRQQLADVETKRKTRSGIAREQLDRLAKQLRQNLQLVQQGQDARQAQVANLAMLVTDAAGILQALQNKLRTTDFADAAQTLEVRSLSEEFNSMQENVDLLVAR